MRGIISKSGNIKRTLLLTFLFLGMYLHAQVLDNSEKYLADFDYFIEKLIETHPNP